MMKFKFINLPELQCQIESSKYAHLDMLLNLDILSIHLLNNGIRFRFDEYGEELNIKPSAFLDYALYRPMQRMLLLPKNVFDFIEIQINMKSKVIRIPKFSIVDKYYFK